MDSLPNKIAYITGASKGLGKALAERLLNDGYFVFGISRTKGDISHSNFQSIPIDLSDIEAVMQFQFFPKKVEKALLVNNAGIIGHISPVGSTDLRSYVDIHHINTIAPQILTDLFFRAYAPTAQKGHVINISSGAGKRPIDAWSAYCSSKAAIDLFTATFSEELAIRSMTNWHAHAIAPGVVDTEMQQTIRSADPESFLALDKFKELHENGELKTPEEVANLLFQVIESPAKFKETIISVRNFE